MTERVDDAELAAGVDFQLGEILYIMGESGVHDIWNGQLNCGNWTYRNIWETMWAGRSVEWLIRITALWGDFSTALKRSREALFAARRSTNPTSLSIALNSSAGLNYLLGDGRRAQENAEEMLALATDHDMPLWTLMANIWRGWALAAQGQVEEGIALLQGGRRASAAAPLVLLSVLPRLAEGYLYAQRPDEGLNVVAEALGQQRSKHCLAQKTGTGLFETALFWTKGELMLLQGATKVAEAENCLGQAIQVARGQGAKLWELRATMSLARLLDKHGRRDEARAILGKIYASFSEGFDTPVLKRAKAKIDELSA